MSNIVAIVGRPNVGKSTLFNRLTGMRQAIVDSVAGVTRDRHYGKSDWNGVSFSVIDTGGYVVGSEDMFELEIRKQVSLAVNEADVILFVVDSKEGVTGFDSEVAAMIRKSNKKVFLVVNKIDSSEHIHHASEFYSLGLEHLFPISAINGSGTGELLDEVVKEFSNPDSEETTDLPRIAVIGRPNVGKSSLVNAWLGTERTIVTPVAGTTRDSIYTRYSAFGFDFMLVDTAGLRKKGKIVEDIEFYSVMRSIRAIENSDVCILLLDAVQGIEAQDINIFRLVEKNNKGVVIVVNKWDLVERKTNTHLEFERAIREKIAPFSDVPIVFTSAINKQRIHKTLEVAKSVYENRVRRISTSKLNELMLPVLAANPPPAYRGAQIKTKYITQLKMAYPAFVFFCNHPQHIKEPYKRFVENKLRENFAFEGTPIKIYFREK